MSHRTVVALLLAALAIAAGNARASARAPRRAKAPLVKAQVQRRSPSPDTLLERARQREAALEYEQVLTFAAAVIDHPRASVEHKLEAYWLRGAALVIVKRPVDAEQAFRVLLRLHPAFSPENDTPAKVLAVFRKVQVDEQHLRQQTQEMERARIVATLQLTGEHPANGRGGEQIGFRYHLRDPHQAVEGVRVQFRRAGDPSFSALALKPQDDSWSGALSADWTSSEEDYVVEFLIEVVDAEGATLLRVDREGQPLRIDVAAGSFDISIPIYESPWFWVGVGVVTVSVGAGAWWAVGQARALPDGDVEPIEVLE